MKNLLFTKLFQNSIWFFLSWKPLGGYRMTRNFSVKFCFRKKICSSCCGCWKNDSDDYDNEEFVFG